MSKKKILILIIIISILFSTYYFKNNIFLSNNNFDINTIKNVSNINFIENQTICNEIIENYTLCKDKILFSEMFILKNKKIDCNLFNNQPVTFQCNIFSLINISNCNLYDAPKFKERCIIMMSEIFNFNINCNKFNESNFCFNIKDELKKISNINNCTIFKEKTKYCKK